MFTQTPAEGLDPRERMEPDETQSTGTENLNEETGDNAGLDDLQEEEQVDTEEDFEDGEE